MVWFHLPAVQSGIDVIAHSPCQHRRLLGPWTLYPCGHENSTTCPFSTVDVPFNTELWPPLSFDDSLYIPFSVAGMWQGTVVKKISICQQDEMFIIIGIPM